MTGILDEAAAWLGSRHIDQWPDSFDPATLLPAIVAGETWIVLRGNRPVGTVTVDLHDPAWLDVPGRALYLHRMASLEHAGFGNVVFGWAEGLARSQGTDRLRLDCVASNARLCQYYADHGFAELGVVTVGGSPGQRDADAADQTLVRRFERPLPPPR